MAFSLTSHRKMVSNINDAESNTLSVLHNINFLTDILLQHQHYIYIYIYIYIYWVNSTEQGFGRRHDHSLHPKLNTKVPLETLTQHAGT